MGQKRCIGLTWRRKRLFSGVVRCSGTMDEVKIGFLMLMLWTLRDARGNGLAIAIERRGCTKMRMRSSRNVCSERMDRAEMRVDLGTCWRVIKCDMLFQFKLCYGEGICCEKCWSKHRLTRCICLCLLVMLVANEALWDQKHELLLLCVLAYDLMLMMKWVSGCVADARWLYMRGSCGRKNMLSMYGCRIRRCGWSGSKLLSDVWLYVGYIGMRIILAPTFM